MKNWTKSASLAVIALAGLAGTGAAVAQLQAQGEVAPELEGIGFHGRPRGSG